MNMESFSEKLRSVSELLRATGKEDAAIRYEQVLHNIEQGCSLDDAARSVLDAGAHGHHCSYTLIEERRVGDLLSVAKTILS